MDRRQQKREPLSLTRSANFYRKNLIHALPYKPSSTARISGGVLLFPLPDERRPFECHVHGTLPAYHRRRHESWPPADHHNAPGVPDPVFCHILQHIKDNSYHIKDLLISESSDIFLKYFRDSLRSLISIYILQSSDHQKRIFPMNFFWTTLQAVLWKWSSGG